MDEVDQDADQAGGCDGAVEGFRIERPAGEPGRPIQSLAEGIGGRSGQHRHGQHADPDDAGGEERKGEDAGNRPQCLRGLRRSLDVGDAVRIEGCRGGDDDEEADQVGEPHAEIGVDPDAVDLGAGLVRRVDQRMRRGVDTLVLRFLRGLPEKAIGSDRRAEHSDDRHDVVLVPAKGGHDEVVGDLGPRHVDR